MIRPTDHDAEFLRSMLQQEGWAFPINYARGVMPVLQTKGYIELCPECAPHNRAVRNGRKVRHYNGVTQLWRLTREGTRIAFTLRQHPTGGFFRRKDIVPPSNHITWVKVPFARFSPDNSRWTEVIDWCFANDCAMGGFVRAGPAWSKESHSYVFVEEENHILWKLRWV